MFLRLFLVFMGFFLFNFSSSGRSFIKGFILGISLMILFLVYYKLILILFINWKFIFGSF